MLAVPLCVITGLTANVIAGLTANVDVSPKSMPACCVKPRTTHRAGFVMIERAAGVKFVSKDSVAGDDMSTRWSIDKSPGDIGRKRT